MRVSFRIGLLVLVAGAIAVPGAFGVSGSDTITTVAGLGTLGYSGDGGQATSAQLNKPDGVAVDGQGNVYIADTFNHRVRKVTAGIITTIAGTGTAGYSGDGGQATSAQLNSPRDVAVDSQGNVYIADYYNHRVREVSGGIITTVAGTGTAGYSGDGGQATSAQLNYPHSMAVDGQGNLYIADESNHRIRKVTGGIITTVAGNGTSGFSGDGGQATSAQLDYPEGVAVDAQGNLYIADSSNQRIRKVTAGIISTIAGTGTAGFSGDGGQATSAQLNYPYHVTVDGQGNLFIGDLDNARVRKVSGGIITTIAGTGTAGFTGDGGPALSAQLNKPDGVAVDPQGNLFIADSSNHRVREVANALPTASFTASPTSGRAPLTVNFDGSASKDPDGTVIAYAWAFGDNGTASGATASHRYASAGTFTAKLTITDDSGASVSTTQAITVRGAPPPPAKPKLKTTSAQVGSATSGKPFTVSMTVTNAKTGKGVKGQVACTGKLDGKLLPTTHHSAFATGKASCSWQMPKTAHGKHFAGSIAETYKGVKVSRSFSTKVG